MPRNNGFFFQGLFRSVYVVFALLSVVMFYAGYPIYLSKLMDEEKDNFSRKC